MIKAYFDGCCEPVNPGGTASYGVAIFRDNKLIWKDSKLFKPIPGKEKETSNNVAEYSGFKAILEYLLEEGLAAEEIEVLGDSQLVIKQMFGSWNINQGFYVPIAWECKSLLKHFNSIKGVWIPREKNSFADALSKAEITKAGVKFRIQREE